MTFYRIYDLMRIFVSDFLRNWRLGTSGRRFNFRLHYLCKKLYFCLNRPQLYFNWKKSESHVTPVKNVTRILPCLFDGSVFENDQIRWTAQHFLTKCRRNSMTRTCPKSMSCLRMGKNKTWINDMESSWNLMSIWIKLPLICDIWHGIPIRIHVTCFTGNIGF